MALATLPVKPVGRGKALVPDPENPDRLVEVRLNVRGDLLAAYLSRDQITPEQYQAGARLRALFEFAARAGYAAVDPGRVQVDGGGTRDAAGEAIGAARQLVEVETVVGGRAYRLLRLVLAEGLDAKAVDRRLRAGGALRRAIPTLVSWSLEDLAVWWNYSSPADARERQRSMRLRVEALSAEKRA